MNRTDWRDAINQMPVFDTHTHLNMPGVPIPAQTFWDIAHYFWFLEELWAVGYPRNASALPEDQRTEAFVAAFNASRNTVWNQIVRRIFNDLYNVDVRGQETVTADFVRKADAAIRWQAWQTDWPQKVVDKLAIRRIAVNNLRESDFPGLPGVGVAVPVWRHWDTWLERLKQAADPRADGAAAVAAVSEAVTALKTGKIRGARVPAEMFERMGKAAVSLPGEPPAAGAEAWQFEAYLAHTLFGALGANGMFAQLFLGIERDVTQKTSMAVDDPRRITNLYPLFERYPDCGFELVVGAPGSNLDAVQAARIYPNVHLGGLWWYNFRASTYRTAMQQRLEAVPASKAALIASDARCIEWCYGKILLVKWLLADFMADQVAGGWLSENDALWVAREWLHDAAARRYS